MGRRALGTLLLVLLVVGLQPATAFGVDGDGETTFVVPFQASHGLSVKLEADDDEIELWVRKKGQMAVYFAPGEVSREGISVKFGSFGEFVVDYEPFRTLETHEPNRHCEGEPATTTEGFFRGTMRFSGERDYFQVEAARVKGTLVLQPEWECDYARAGASRVRRRRADDKATLGAYSRHDRIGFGVIASRLEDERPSTFFFATSQEVREKVGIYRLTYAGTRSAGFEFDNRRGTAFVDPPAPFAGSAHYLRRPDAPDRWGGTLTAPLLGLGRVRLAGPGFKARMVPRLPSSSDRLVDERYSLLMAKKVKDQTMVSSKHQVTIPAGAFRTAGLAPGDELKVEAEGAGRVVLTRIDELVDRYSGCLETGGDLRERVEGLRGEWR